LLPIGFSSVGMESFSGVGGVEGSGSRPSKELRDPVVGQHGGFGTGIGLGVGLEAREGTVGLVRSVSDMVSSSSVREGLGAVSLDRSGNRTVRASSTRDGSLVQDGTSVQDGQGNGNGGVVPATPDNQVGQIPQIVRRYTASSRDASVTADDKSKSSGVGHGGVLRNRLHQSWDLGRSGEMLNNKQLYENKTQSTVPAQAFNTAVLTSIAGLQSSQTSSSQTTSLQPCTQFNANANAFVPTSAVGSSGNSGDDTSIQSWSSSTQRSRQLPIQAEDQSIEPLARVENSRRMQYAGPEEFANAPTYVPPYVVGRGRPGYSLYTIPQSPFFPDYSNYQGNMPGSGWRYYGS
jgi:hypothetical protein